MINLYLKILNILSTKFRKKITLFFVFLSISTILEFFSILIIFPGLSLILNENSSAAFTNNEYFNKLNLSKFETIDLIIYFILFYLLLSVLKSSFMLFFNWWRNDFAFDVESDLAKKLYGNYLKLPLEKYNSINSGTLSKNVIIEIKKARLAIDLFLRIFIESLTILIIILVLLYFQPFSTLIIIFLTFVVASIILLFYKKKMYNLGTIEVYYSGKMFQSLQDGFGSFKSILLKGNQNFFVNSFSKPFNKRQYTHKWMQINVENIRIIIEFFAVVLLVIIIFIILKLDNDLKNLVPTLALFGAALFRILPLTNRLLSYFTSIEASKSGINLIDKDFKKNIKNEIQNKINFSKLINFKDVSFSYTKSNNKILDKLNFTIKKNDFIVLSGASGFGKTTFVDLLSGLLRPTAGKISVDGDKIIYNENSWKKNIGYVPQSIFILDSTLKENIVFDEKRIDEKKLLTAINLSNLKNFVAQKKEGINFKVGEKGSNLSGGQVQRLGIARAIYQSPEILICDEITNSLDRNNEKKIIDSLIKLRKKMTIVCITHNLNAFKSKYIKKYRFIKSNKNITRLKKI